MKIARGGRAGLSCGGSAGLVSGGSAGFTGEHALKAVVTERAEHGYVLLEDRRGVREGRDGAAHAGFPEQVQDRVGRAVAGIGGVARVEVPEQVVRVKARNLERAAEARFL